MQWNNHFYTAFSLPERQFLTTLSPKPLVDTRLVAWSDACATSVGVAQNDFDWPGMMSARNIPSGAQPCATVYSGHQFGHWAGQLG
jgi:serine/tyrosine/threonine adenylyltransferase